MDPKDVHRWRIRGILIQEIKATFEKIPESHRGGYYPWFLQNQWVLEPSQPPPDLDPLRNMMLRGWRYSIEDPTSNTPTDRIKMTVMGWPEDKQVCSELCLLSLSTAHPSPEQKSWLYFGFCACHDEEEESRLGVIYMKMIQQCTFSELLAAYRASSLAALMDKYGLHAMREPMAHLQDVLSGTGSGQQKSVWWLKVFVLGEEIAPIPAVTVDYGFMNCREPQDREVLKGIYKKFFECERGDPIMLHNAAVAGKLFEYVGGVVKVKKRFKSLMKNPYPLPNPESLLEIAN